MSRDTTPSSEAPLRIGVSACLLGAQVRYDGGHKRDAFLVDMLGRYAEFVPVCPELELGLGVPRETIRLVARDGEIRLVANESGRDLSEQMRAYARKKVRELEALELSGYVLKKNSPSCGLYRVKVYGGPGRPAQTGRGLFAEALVERFPHLPIEEEGRLCDAKLRESFVERVFAYRRLRDLFQERWTVGRLVEFHAQHKLTLMAHSPPHYTSLGRMVAAAKGTARVELRERYELGFMEALEIPATPGRHANVMMHIAGYFKTKLDEASKRELLEHIEDFRRGLLPRVVPLTLLRHYTRLYDIEYLAKQRYLAPHPKELMLLNHV